MTVDTAALEQRYLEAQLAGDRHEAVRLLYEEGLRAGVPVQTLRLDVIQRAQYEIGRLWQENRISVADEHLATAISQLAMARLYPEAPRAPGLGRTVALACVEGELHDMGVRVAADMLEMEGLSVQCLGASVPTEHLVARMLADRPDALLLSATMTFNLPALRSAVEAVRKAVPGLPVLAGGFAFQWSPGATEGLELPVAGPDAMAMVRDVRQILHL